MRKVMYQTRRSFPVDGFGTPMGSGSVETLSGHVEALCRVGAQAGQDAFGFGEREVVGCGERGRVVLVLKAEDVAAELERQGSQFVIKDNEGRILVLFEGLPEHGAEAESVSHG